MKKEKKTKAMKPVAKGGGKGEKAKKRPSRIDRTLGSIGERKNPEERLTYQAQLLTILNEAVIASDSQYRITAWNAAAEAMYGWKAEDVLGRFGLDITQTEYPGIDKAEMLRTIAEVGSWRGEATQARKDGTRFPVEVSSIVLRDASGKATGFVSVNRDISGRKRAEEQIQAALLEKELLLKEIHHRVKNNLQIISGLLTLQAAQIDDERLTKMIIESQNRIRTMALIHQMLYQSGNLTDIDMGDYIRNLAGNLISSHSPVAVQPRVGFDLAPLRLAIDKAIPLALIFNELLTNALKHAFPGRQPGEIRIALQECRDTACRALSNQDPVPDDTMDTTPREGVVRRPPTHELTVADNGAGLPAGFDATKQKSPGLQLVIMLVKQLNGTLAIESSGGTSVRIAFNADEKSKKRS